MPKALVRGYKALYAAAPVAIRVGRAPGQHGFQDLKQVLGNFQIGCVASVMEGNQHFIRKPPGVARNASWRGGALDYIGWRHHIVHILLKTAFHVMPHISKFPIYSVMRSCVDQPVNSDIPEIPYLYRHLPITIYCRARPKENARTSGVFMK